MTDRLEVHSIAADLAALDDEHAEWEEIAETHTVRDYENHEDFILAFADTAEAWIRAALEVLDPAEIQKVDRHLTEKQESKIKPSQPGTETGARQ